MAAPLPTSGCFCYTRTVTVGITELSGVDAAGESTVFGIKEHFVGSKKTGKGRRKIGRKKRRNRAKIRHRK